MLEQTIDKTEFDAVVKMSISPSIHLPEDTVATIDSSGLLGDKFLKLLPGKSAKTIAPGGVIAQTKSYRILRRLRSPVRLPRHRLGKSLGRRCDAGARCRQG